jgi:D-threo-aldose 1-dehydrogenase
MIDIFGKVPFGKQVLEVPRFGLGCAPLGTFENATDATPLVEHVWERGIRFFDTAPLYGRGRSERHLGAVLSQQPRDEFVLSTKVGRLVRDGNVVFDFSADGIRRSLDESFARLGLDRPDIVLIHDPHQHYQQALYEAYPVLEGWRAEGVVKAIGVGIGNWQMLRDFALNADFDCFLLPGRYTLLEQVALPLLDVCSEKGIDILVGGVCNGGLLASDLSADVEHKYNYRAAPQEILDKARKLEEECRRHDVPMGRAALHFPSAHEQVKTMVIGAEEIGQIDGNLEDLAADVPTALWRDLQSEGLLDSAATIPS